MVRPLHGPVKVPVGDGPVDRAERLLRRSRVDTQELYPCDICTKHDSDAITQYYIESALIRATWVSKMREAWEAQRHQSALRIKFISAAEFSSTSEGVAQEKGIRHSSVVSSMARRSLS